MIVFNIYLGIFNKVNDAAKFINKSPSTICYMCSNKETLKRKRQKNKFIAKYI